MKQNWEYKKLGDVCVSKSGIGRALKTFESNDEILYIDIASIDNQKHSITSYTQTKLSEAPSRAQQCVKKEDILVSLVRPNLKNVAIVGDDENNLVASSGFCVLRAGEDLLPQYVFQFVCSDKFTDYLVGLTAGANYPAVREDDVRNAIVPIPPLSEQSRIVAELDLLTGIIDKQNAQLKELDNLAQAIFYDMFGDPIQNEKGWTVKNLGELCDVYRGGSPRPIEQFLGGTIPWIKIGDATKGDDIYLHQTKEHIIEDGLKKTRYIHSGSLIFANCGVSLGFARIITFDGCIHDGWLAFDNVSTEVEKIFLLKSLNFCTQYFRDIAPDGTQPNLNTSIMKSFKQIVPPLDIQRTFVSKIESIVHQKMKINQSIADTQKLLDYTMDKYFG